MDRLPEHLKKYIVTQNYSKYTPVDQACWRYILRQLKDFFSVHGHESYLDGLAKTGITEDEIPHIEKISEHLEKFGWRAIPVSGFIPPAAFMELQSLSVLPIASDMRTLEHISYTPAPDIVHEAAGHAPIIVDPEYSAYLKEYAQVSKKAIISKEDLDIYEAIRVLSDIKENPSSTEADIKKAEAELEETVNQSTHVSEATELSRMNWWTAEYGLIGSLENPKIYGAGLLSSIGESRECLKPHVKKIPLSVECLKQSYNITEPQPQLFVTPDFKTLVKVLHEMSEKMAYKVGGAYGLKKAIEAKSINTIELENGLQISGEVSEFIENKKDEIIFVKLSGPSQISYKDHQCTGHSPEYHQQGYSTPLGSFVANSAIKENSSIELVFNSGFKISGLLKKIVSLDQKLDFTNSNLTTIDSNAACILTFSQATVSYKDKIYFQPDWGDFDLVTGSKVVSVFGGPADRKNFGQTEDFVAARVPQPQYTDQEKQKFSLYSEIKTLRLLVHQNLITADAFIKRVNTVIDVAINSTPDQWLLFVEIFEVLYLFESQFKKSLESENIKVTNHIEELKKQNSNIAQLINNGIRLLYA